MSVLKFEPLYSNPMYCLLDYGDFGTFAAELLFGKNYILQPS